MRVLGSGCVKGQGHLGGEGNWSVPRREAAA